MKETLMRPIFLSFVLLPILITACSTPDKSARWENIGTISNGNIHTYINKDSVRKNGNLMIFQDKKVVTNLKQERFANTPAYKTAIAEWEIHCNNKTYRLSSLQLFDTKNTEISTQNYTASSLRPMSILSGTLTEKQYETVCGKKL
ncbi:TPA: surface-adhesin E family protein [Neisseria meningitidis]|uniref:surface-adhesin E family protein n=1 Tax=Neisseria TaxID=482 RepID=UPI00201D6561|nr:surface-adhesin E family protein [Neisseria gonorrhoeae]